MERVGGYEIVRVIARGGMATVYEARQPALERSVALKRLDLRTDDPTLAERFIRESRIAAAFDHPNIVTVFDFFECDGTPYIAMELLPRGSLRPWIGKLTLPQAFGVLEGVLAGLAHAEQRGVAHRDLKPENVLITHDGAVKLADFGIAKAYTTATGALTVAGTPVGTAAYMAPEQAMSRPVGPRTDLYAVGAMAYELFAGAPPFGGDTLPAVLYRHVNEPPPPLAGVDERIAAWVGWLLEKQPEARPPGAAAAWHALEDVVVDLLGPYWRRHAPLRGSPRAAGEAAATTAAPGAATSASPAEGDEAGVEATRIGPAPDEEATRIGPAPGEEPTRVGPAPDEERPAPAWRPWALGAAVAVLAAAIVVAVVLASGGGSPGPGAPRPHAAAAFDFDGDGEAAVVAGLPAWPGGGAIALPGSDALVTAADLGAPQGRLGAALASGDFDRDGHADLAIGDPGDDAGAVVVLDGTAQGLDRSPAATPTGPAGFGTALAVADLDGDGHADLAVAGAGPVKLLFGGADGLGGERTRTLPLPAGTGRLLAAGDIDGDRRPDLVAAGGDGIAVCPGRRGGPRVCRTLAMTGAAALAMGDFSGDGIDDVVAGAPSRGAVEVWRGDRRGLIRRPTTITQESRHVPGHEQPGDDFGAAVALADVDGDGTQDLLVGAPGEDDDAGRVTMVPGASAGRGIAYGQDVRDVPGPKGAGHRFGAALAAAGESGRTMLAVAAPGASRAIVTMDLQRSGLPGPGGRAMAIPGGAADRQAGIRLGA